MTTILVTIVFVFVVGMLANSVRTNNARAEDWHRRAIAAEEIVGGLRVVIAERSQALNQRTVQANRLVATLDSSRGALRESKVSVGSLTRRQRQLATEKARADAQLRNLRAQQSALVSAAAALNACSQGLEAAAVGRSGKPKATPASVRSRVARCDRAQARFRAVLEQLG